MILPIALTCGEPAGIGPELAARAWEQGGGRVPFFLIGDPRHARAVSGAVPVIEITRPAEAVAAGRHGLPVLAHAFPAAAVPGRPAPENAVEVIAVIARGVELVRAGEAAALCTLPINKQALKEGAGFAYPGHTEYLAHLAGVEHVAMMLACPKLRVVPVTIHVALEDVPGMLTRALLAATLGLADEALRRDFAISAPRIAVAGLNPHAGEGGVMGREEIEIIAPVLDEMRGAGLKIAGPLAADTMFHARARESYDVAVAMYHDQALIAIKTLDFAGGVNITLGLPFVRTSPDHGTAFDIAGRFQADPTSTLNALAMAARMATRRGR